MLDSVRNITDTQSEQIIVEGEDSDDSIVVYNSQEERDQADLHDKEVKHLSRPFFLGKFFVHYPYIAIVLCFIILAVCAGLTVAFDLMALDN